MVAPATIAAPEPLEGAKGADWLRHFQLVSAPAHSADLSTTSLSTSWTTGSGATDVAAGDTILIFCVGFGGASISTPSGWTLELNSGNEYYVFSKVAVASEPNVTFTSASAQDMSCMAIAARDVASVEKATVAWLTNSWYYGGYGATFQPSVDLTGGASADWTLLNITVGSANGDHYIVRVADDANIFADRDEAWLGEEFVDQWSGGYRMSAIEWNGEFFRGDNDNDVQLKVSTAESPSSVAQFQVAVQMSTPTTDSEVANTVVETVYTPGDTNSDVHNIAAQPIYTPGDTNSDIFNVASQALYTPGDTNSDVHNVAIQVLYTPSLNALSAITMLMENPDLVAQDDTEIVEYRYPDIGSAVRAIKVSGVSGNLVRQWTLVVNLEQILNVDNEPVQPDTVYDALQASAARNLIVPFSDLVGSVFRDEEEDVDVKIEEVTLLAKNIAQVKVVEVL